MLQPLFGPSLLAEDYLPQSAGSTFPGAVQGDPECKGPPHVQHGVHQDPRPAKFLSTQDRRPLSLYWCVMLFLFRGRTWHFAKLHAVTFFFSFPQEKLDQGILEVPSKLLFSDFEISPCLPVFQPAEVPLSGSTLIWSVSHSSWICVLFEPAEGVRG